MKILSAKQIRQWDEYTIANEPVSSTDLMERAAGKCAAWLMQKFDRQTPYKIFCGKGNNGGDGLAIARMLIDNGILTIIYIVGKDGIGSADFEINLNRLRKKTKEIHDIDATASLPAISKDDVVIDALFGSGLNKKPSGIFSKVINHLNRAGASIVSIDFPSGLYADKSSKGNEIIEADHTLTFQERKLAFLMAENERFAGKVVVLDIGLSRDFHEKENSKLELVDESIVASIFQPRKEFSNKGDYGYACLMAGSYGMMGAAILSARACLRSGVGKLTCYTCKEGYAIMQTAVPEAMCKTSGTTFIKDVKDLKGFSAVGIGPGIGQHPSHRELLKKIFAEFDKPLVIDADGLNTLSKYPSLYGSIPANSIITPHPKEFERLFGKSSDDFGRMELAMQKAKALHIYIVLKGHHTFIATPEGKGYFNNTGNSGMATAGSGDVLTGILTSLLAQKYSSLHSCIIGVYLHGLAGDIAARTVSKEAMIAGDIISHLGEAFLSFERISSTR